MNAKKYNADGNSEAPKYEVGPIGWPEYEAIQKKIISLIKSDLTRAVLDDLAKFSEEAATGNGIAAFARMKSLPDAVEMVFTALNECASEMIAGCVRGGIDVDSMSAVEVVRLRKECMMKSDLASVVKEDIEFYQEVIWEVIGVNGAAALSRGIASLN